ncbi:zinc finger matrin-type protein 4-like isoform X1 [Leucoraja erinacea]|uniref:zinc finger matrin-type protein 4-like isoform X1 n=1 Tax=Leucoraja erinaceus TaxID=7782 RepID=UPI002455DF0D|nr:zinc finger matrin-type protein 4-like isoform X1 [Leucoraja erinacea]
MASERPIPQLMESSTGNGAVQKIIEGNSELFTDTHCKVCNAVLISESQRLAHYQSKKHANKVRRYEELHQDGEPVAKIIKKDPTDNGNGEVDRNKYCPLCNVTFTAPVVAQSHYQGKNHAKTLKLKQKQDEPVQASSVEVAPKVKNESAPAPTVQSSDVSWSSDPDRYCSLCQAFFNHADIAKQHYVGKRHKKRETKAKLLEQLGQADSNPVSAKGYPCNTCNIVLNSIEQYQAHIQGTKHQNHLKPNEFIAAEDNEEGTVTSWLLLNCCLGVVTISDLCF